MKIGIDASLASSNKKTGVENYVYEICDRIGKFSHSDITLYFNKKPSKTFENVKTKPIPFPKFWRTIRLPLSILRDKPDVFFEPANLLPFYSPNKSVVTVHDLAVKRFPSAYRFWDRVKQNYFLWHTSIFARTIIAVSETTKNDLLMNYPRTKEKTVVISPSYSEIFDTSEKHASPIKDRYILYVGRIEKRKNIKTIVQAFEKISKEKKIAVKLLIVGAPGYGYDEVKEIISKNDDIVTVGHKTAEELISYYQNAECLVFPSLYEGFGMPILESMACKTPVITSNDKWAKEVAGDAAWYVDPSSVTEIYEAMSTLASDHFIHDKYIKLGTENIKRFSWDRSVENISKLLESM